MIPWPQVSLAGCPKALVSKASVLGQHAVWIYPHGLKILLRLKPQLSPKLAFPQGQHGHWQWAEKEDWGGHVACALHHQNQSPFQCGAAGVACILPCVLTRPSPQFLCLIQKVTAVLNKSGVFRRKKNQLPIHFTSIYGVPIMTLRYFSWSLLGLRL